MKECLYCNKELNNKSDRAKFCNDLCRASFHQKKRISNGDEVISIKFEKVKFVQVRNPSIKTAKQLFDFLFDEYCKLYKVEKKSIFDVKEEIKESYNSVQPKSVNYFETPKPKKVKTVMDYVEERIECGDKDGYNKWLIELENDTNLTKKQKELAKTAQP